MSTIKYPAPFSSSVISFPDRGPWGKSNYRGNCSGHVQRGLIGTFRPSHFCDPSEGGGTSRDVCREIGLKYTGLDLRDGFNIVADRLRDRVEAAPDFIFWHPPYGEMIKYSGNMWGEAHPDDLSRCGNGDEFMAKMELAIANIYDALASDGHYSVLIGDLKKNGALTSWQSDIANLGIGTLKNIMIKMQHNCVSGRSNYSGNFIPTDHEYLLIFSKDRRIISMGEMLLERNARIAKRRAGTWKEIVARAARDFDGRFTIGQLVERVLERVDAPGNNNVAAKVRQILQSDAFRRLTPGVYEMAEPVAA